MILKTEKVITKNLYEDSLIDLSDKIYHSNSTPSFSHDIRLITFEIFDPNFIEYHVNRCLLYFWIDIRNKKDNIYELKTKKRNRRGDVYKIYLIFEFNFVNSRWEYDTCGGCGYKHDWNNPRYFDSRIEKFEIYRYRRKLRIFLRTISLYKNEILLRRA